LGIAAACDWTRLDSTTEGIGGGSAAMAAAKRAIGLAWMGTFLNAKQQK